MPNNGKCGNSAWPIALISRLPDWVVQSVLPIAIHRLLHRLYPLARLEQASPLPNHVRAEETESIHLLLKIAKDKSVLIINSLVTVNSWID